jgi:hypothetical protein
MNTGNRLNGKSIRAAILPSRFRVMEGFQKAGRNAVSNRIGRFTCSYTGSKPRSSGGQEESGIAE